MSDSQAQDHTKARPASTSRLTLIDGLRGIASLLVITVHFSGYWNPTRTRPLSSFMLQIADLGHLGVDIFFVLSGFVIAYSLFGKHIDFRTFGRFVLRRSMRIDPPYWAAIAVFYLFLILQWKFGKKPEFPATGQVVAHIFYLQTFLGYEQINVVFWTLCIEIQFYIFFFLTLLLIKRSNCLPCY